jgi:hypothetical protein
MYKFIFSILIVFNVSCLEIERDNILDPKNPSGKSESVILLEAFVNTTHLSLYNSYALEAIDNLKDLYKDRLIIAEMHKNVTGDPDTLSLAENENLHNKYTVNYLPESGRNKGLPDLFLNGAENRVQGAYSVSNVVSRVQEIASSLLLNKGYYTIEADIQKNENTISGKFRIARLGDSASDETILRIYVTYNSEFVNGKPGTTGKRTVCAIKSYPVSSVSAGDYIEENFNIDIQVSTPEKIIFVLKDQSDLTVLHALEKEIL